MGSGEWKDIGYSKINILFFKIVLGCVCVYIYFVFCGIDYGGLGNSYCLEEVSLFEYRDKFSNVVSSVVDNYW